MDIFDLDGHRLGTISFVLPDLNTPEISLFWVIMVDNINKKGFDISSIARFAGMSNATLHHVFEKFI